MYKKVIIISFLLSLISSCDMNKQQMGTLIGGATGAAIGSRFGKGSGQLVGVGLGAVAGGLLGNQIGSYMDEQDKARYQRASQHALEDTKSGQTVAWKNPDSGNHGTITPVKTYENNGRYCREYTQTVTIGNKTHEAYGKACRQPDGSWQIINN